MFQLLYQKITGLKTDLSGPQEVSISHENNSEIISQQINTETDSNCNNLDKTSDVSVTNNSNSFPKPAIGEVTVDSNNDDSCSDNDDNNIDNSDGESDSSEAESGTGKKGTIIRPRNESPDSKKVFSFQYSAYYISFAIRSYI